MVVRVSRRKPRTRGQVSSTSKGVRWNIRSCTDPRGQVRLSSPTGWVVRGRGRTTDRFGCSGRSCTVSGEGITAAAIARSLRSRCSNARVALSEGKVSRCSMHAIGILYCIRCLILFTCSHLFSNCHTLDVKRMKRLNHPNNNMCHQMQKNASLHQSIKST